MENKVLADNLQILAKYDPVLAKRVEIARGTSSLELSKTQAGEYNLIYNGKEIHSSQNAVLEAKKIAQGISNIDKPDSICVIFGLGLGYLFDEAVQRAKGSVVVYEPSMDILVNTLKIVELKEQLSRENVFLCADTAKLKEHIKNLAGKETDITISFLSSYKELFANELNEVAHIVQYAQGEGQAFENTMNNVAQAAVFNTFFGMKQLDKSFFIKELTDVYKNKPALVVSSGPSLAKNIDFIKQNMGKMVIFCVGNAAKLLTDNKIPPDFICVVETSSSEGQLTDVPLKISKLIVEPYTHPYVWHRTESIKILHPSKDNFLNDWLCKALKISNEGLFSKGTVSYCALSSAKLMGCNPIILVGQDLAYTDGRCYAKGSAYDELVCELDSKSQKFHIYPRDFEKYKYEFLGNREDIEDKDEYIKTVLKFFNDNLYTVRGQNGELLPTQTGYALFIKHFEEFAAQNPKPELINASVGGAQINGYKNMALNDVKLGAEFDKNVEMTPPEYDFENLDKEISKLKDVIKKCLEEFNELEDSVQKIKKEFRPKNIEKLSDKFKARVNAFYEGYFSSNKVIYFYLYKNFMPLYRANKVEIFEKQVKSCIEDLENISALI